MWKKLLKFARRQLWKFRFMLYWRDVAIVLLCAFMIAWVASPIFFGGYFAESPFLSRTPLKYLGFLCFPMLFLNLSLVEGKDNIVCCLRRNLIEDRKELKSSVSSAKDAMRLLKKIGVAELEAWERDVLRNRLVDIGAEEDKICILMLGLNKNLRVNFRE